MVDEEEEEYIFFLLLFLLFLEYFLFPIGEKLSLVGLWLFPL